MEGNRIGQQYVTMQQAREFYGLNQIPESSLDENTTPVQTNQTDSDEQKISGNLFVRKFTSLIRELIRSPDKKKFVIDAFEGFVAVSKSKLNRLINGVSDNDMKVCIIELKDFLKEKIKEQIDLLRKPATVLGDTTSEPSEPSASSALGLFKNGREMLNKMPPFGNPFGSR